VICDPCRQEADRGNTQEHLCTASNCTCQHKLEKGVYLNTHAISKANTERSAPAGGR
jgi:hypothetical protein